MAAEPPRHLSLTCMTGRANVEMTGTTSEWQNSACLCCHLVRQVYSQSGIPYRCLTHSCSWRPYLLASKSVYLWSMLQDFTYFLLCNFFLTTSSKCVPVEVEIVEVVSANTLGHNFSNNTSTQHYSNRFNAHRLLAERHQLKFNSNNNEAYNSLFSMDELSKAIAKSSYSAVGPDDIHYQMLKHLPESALSTLLHIINKHWYSESCPSIWQHAVVLPIPKADKDKTDPCSYRPIALTSCLCKIAERMINERLVWYLEKHKLITHVQSGFRKNRSTTDQLVRLFILRQHTTCCRSVFWLGESLWHNVETWYHERLVRCWT